MTSLLLLAVAAALIATFLTHRVLQYARQHALFDVPNVRSSHDVPTPRGGGLASAVVITGGILLLPVFAPLGWVEAIALAVSGAVVAVIGWIDDHRSVSARSRFLVHLIAVTVVLTGTAAIGPISMPGVPQLPLIQLLSAGFALVWLINLFNFMDGIDGLAGAEAVFVAAALACCLVLLGAGSGAGAALAALVAGAATGFLVWNWPPARIFMGDVGSGFLGYALGAVALVAHRESGLSLWVPTILLAVFVTDATVTLLRRMARGERWYAAHRSHGYQWLARKHQAHRPVTIGVMVLNLVWLLPLALLATRHPVHAGQIAVLAYLPLLPLALLVGSGRAE
jgi:Fuc2NAc and GlcNAc transferase